MPRVTSTAVRRVTSSDVAREAGVSRATVGFVLNRTPGQTISAETQQRVVAAAERLGYRPNEAARHLARGRTMIVLMVLPDWPMEHNMQRNIETAAMLLDQAGYTLVTHTPTNSTRRPLWEALNPDVVVGMAPFSEAMMTSMRASGVRHIVGSSSIGDAVSEHQPHSRGPALQVQHLVSLGHRRLGYATTPDPRLQDLQKERLAEAHETAISLGVELKVIAGDPAEALREWRKAGCTGIVAFNDEVAARVLRAALVAGIDVPKDLSIIGHDDAPIAEMLLPSLSSIRQDHEALGVLLVQTVLAAVEGDDSISEPDDIVSLVQRESTAPPRA
ncbi:MAG: LacI family DNA-binding transcriptional regulator [Actinobacteria bacterium]|nr:LacI family DNA-binding transcriptional regulator [Actinomycetota bacterium]